jgi:DnaJ-class molecular chaperone
MTEYERQKRLRQFERELLGPCSICSGSGIHTYHMDSYYSVVNCTHCGGNGVEPLVD